MCMTRKRSVAMAVFSCALAWVAGPAHALPADNGSTWAGTMAADTGKTLRVVATFGEGAVSLRFGEPAACAIDAGVLRADAGSRTYRFKVSRNGGPFCAKLYPGELSLTVIAADVFETSFRRQQAVWSGRLERVVER